MKNLLKLSILFNFVLVSLNAQTFAWTLPFGTGFGANHGFAITTDAAGNVYTTGDFGQIIDFDPGIIIYNLSPNGANDVFINKLDAAGNFVWAKKIGGATADAGHAINLDAAGNVYVGGAFTGTVDFDPGPGTFTLASTGGPAATDAFLCKLDASGNFLWACKYGNLANDDLVDITVDASLNVYATGSYSGTVDFDPSASTYTMMSNGFSTFITKLSPAGNFIWAKSLDGSQPAAIEFDGSNNVVTCGVFSGTLDCDPGPGTYTLASFAVSQDVYIVKLDNAGNFVWAKQIGGTATDGVSDMDLDATDNIYLSGSFNTTCDFDPSAATFNLVSAGGYDIFMSKLDPLGNFVWAKRTGGINNDLAHTIGIDPVGNIYSSGYFTTTIDFDPGPGVFNLTSVLPAVIDIYITKFDLSGIFLWAGQIGGTATQKYTTSLATDPSGNVFYTGYFNGLVDFDPSPATFTLTASVPAILISKLGACFTPTIPSSINGNATICNGTQQTYSVTLVAGNNYTWTLPGGWSGTSTTNIITTTVGASSGTISVVSGNGCGTSPAQTVAVTVNSSPVLTITPASNSICVGNSATLNVSGASTYTWSTASNATSIAVSPTITTTYSVTGTNAAGCMASASKTVTVVALPSLTVTSSSNTICSGSSVTLTASGASTYTWNTGPTTPAISPSPTVNTTYTVTGTSAVGCTNTSVKTITVNLTPTVSVSGGASPVCAGTQVLLTASGAITYSWSTSALTATIAPSPTITTNYTVIGTSAGCSNSIVKTITVNPLPTLTIAVSNTLVCSGNTLALTASGALTYTWSGSVINAVPFSPTITTNYTVTGTSAAGCNNTAAMTVSVNNVPTAPLSISGPTALCAGSSATTYSTNIVAGASSYVWTLPGGWGGASTTNSISATPGASGGTISVFASNTCGNSSTQTLVVVINPVPSVTANGNPLSVCPAANVTLSASGANTYTWSSGPTVATITVNPLTTTIYTVTGTNTLGCNNFTTITIGVFSNPTVSAVSNSNILCVGQTATLTAGGATSYTWNPGGAATSIVVSPTVTTTYTVTGTDGNSCTSSVVYTQSVSTCTGLFALNSKGSEIKVYPNPFNNKITIVVNGTEQVKLFNVLGMLVYSGDIKDKSEIDLTEKPNGIYFIHIGSVTKKIIKE